MSAEANPPPPKPPLSDRWSRVSPWTPCSRSSTLPPEGRATFDRVVETVEAMGDDASNYTDAIRRYALADATAAIVREAWEAEGRPVVRPATGSTPARPHPLLVALRESETHAQTLGAALLLDPAARAKAGRSGWRKGQARAPAHQLRHDDGGTLVRELYGHPDAAIARQRIRAAFRATPEVVALGTAIPDRAELGFGRP